MLISLTSIYKPPVTIPLKVTAPPDSIHSATKTLTFGTLSSNARSGIITSEATTNENA